MDKESTTANHGAAFEEVASILSSLAIEGILFAPQQLDRLLKDFDLSPKLRGELIKIFGKNGSKNGNGKNLPGEGK